MNGTGPQPHDAPSDAQSEAQSERYSGRRSGRPTGGAASAQLSAPAGAVSTQGVVLGNTSDDATPTTATLARLADQLPPRDHAVLGALGALRLMTGRQLQRLLFATGSHGTRALRARRSLQRLHTLGLVVRLGARHVGGAGGGAASYTYHLSDDGQRLLGVRRPVQPHSLQGAREHTLAVSELAVRLHEAHRAGTVELLHFEAEPACWRPWHGSDGHRHHVRPDAFLIVAAGPWERLWFVELDRGTQSPATLRRKANGYHAYAQTGIEQERHGVFPRVAYLTTAGARRAVALAVALAATPDADQLATVAELVDATHSLAHPPDTEQPT